MGQGEAWGLGEVVGTIDGQGRNGDGKFHRPIELVNDGAEEGKESYSWWRRVITASSA